MPHPPPDDPDALLTRIDLLLADNPDPDPDDPYPWSDAMVWHAPIATHCPVTGRVYLDAAGWLV